MPFGGESLSRLASATDAVSTPTTWTGISGGIQGTREGSNPSPITERQPGALFLNNDTVVQRRRAGQRRQYRPAPPSPVIQPQHAAVGRWLRRCAQCRSS